MNDSNNLSKKSLINVFVLVIIAISVYIGFEPLIALVPDGVSKAVISSSFGAIFVIILTMYLLNKQTEIEQESIRGEKLFEERLTVFKEALKVIEEMLKDDKISFDEIKSLRFRFIELCMLCEEDQIEKFTEVYALLNEIYNLDNKDDKGDEVLKSKKNEVEISEERQNELIELLFAFSNVCRTNLQANSSPLDKKYIDEAILTVSKTETKSIKDNSKYIFKDISHPKNRYIHAVIKNFAESKIDSKGEKTIMTEKEFKTKIPNKVRWHSNVWATLEKAEETKKRDRKRHFMSKDEIINLKDKDDNIIKICITNGQSITAMEDWKKHFKNHGIEYE